MPPPIPSTSSSNPPPPPKPGSTLRTRLLSRILLCPSTPQMVRSSHRVTAMSDQYPYDYPTYQKAKTTLTSVSMHRLPRIPLRLVPHLRRLLRRLAPPHHHDNIHPASPRPRDAIPLEQRRQRVVAGSTQTRRRDARRVREGVFQQQRSASAGGLAAAVWAEQG